MHWCIYTYINVCVCVYICLCIYESDTSQPNTFHINYFRANERKRKIRFGCMQFCTYSPVTNVCMSMCGWITVCQVHFNHRNKWGKLRTKYKKKKRRTKEWIVLHNRNTNHSFHFQTDDAFDSLCAFSLRYADTKRITLVRWRRHPDKISFLYFFVFFFSFSFFSIILIVIQCIKTPSASTIYISVKVKR